MLPPENILRALVAPELLHRPIYLIDAEDAPELCGRGHTVAWTGPIIDLVFQEHLQAEGRWAGRGPAIVLECGFHLLWQDERAAILCHEIAHWADARSGDRDANLSKFHADRAREEFIRNKPPHHGSRYCPPTPATELVDDGAHDLRFARAAYHAAYRWAQGTGVRPSPAWLLTGVGVSFEHLEPHLALEADERRFESLTSVAESPLPAGLTGLAVRI